MKRQRSRGISDRGAIRIFSRASKQGHFCCAAFIGPRLRTATPGGFAALKSEHGGLRRAVSPRFNPPWDYRRLSPVHELDMLNADFKGDGVLRIATFPAAMLISIIGREQFVTHNA